MIIEKSLIKSKRLFLRGLRSEDSNGNYPQWFNDQEVCNGNSHGLFPMDSKSLIDYIESSYKSNNLLVLAIVEMEFNNHIGNVALQNINWINRSAEFAIIIGEKNFWGKGFATEAATSIVLHGFNSLNLRRIYCGTFSNNIGMIKLAKSLNMTQEGVRRKAIFKNGEYLDMLDFAVMRDEYFLNKGFKDENN